MSVPQESLNNLTSSVTHLQQDMDHGGERHVAIVQPESEHATVANFVIHEIPHALRCITPFYKSTIRYYKDIYEFRTRQGIYSINDKSDSISFYDVVYVMTCIESSFDIIKEFKLIQADDIDQNIGNIAHDMNKIYQILAEDIGNFRRHYESAFMRKHVIEDFDTFFGRNRNLASEALKVETITSMAIFYRDKGNADFEDHQKKDENAESIRDFKRKAAQHFHSAAIFFHSILLQFDSVESDGYLAMRRNFDHCRGRILACSDLIENLVSEHFLFKRNGVIVNEKGTEYKFNDMTLLNYEVCDDGKLVGEGGFGTVFKVKRRSNGVEYACKKINTTSMDFKKLSSLHHEIAIMKQVDHPNIVKLTEVFYDGRHVYLVMELCKGGDLATFLIERLCRSFREPEAAKLLRDMVSSIQYLHDKNIIHRDIKLDNFVLHFDDHGQIVPMVINTSSYNSILGQGMALNRQSEVKLTDFGLAKYSDDHFVPALAGSTPYIAPELFSGVQYGKKCDIWSLGVVAYTMLMGEFPFKGENESEQLKSIRDSDLHFDSTRGIFLSPTAIDFLTCLLRKDPAIRMELSEAQRHPFLNDPVSTNPSSSSIERESSATSLSSREGGSIASSLKHYLNMNKFNQLLCKLVVRILNPPQISHLRSIFHKFDKDNNGYVSTAELRAAFKEYKETNNVNTDVIDDLMEREDFKELERNNKEIGYSDFIAAAFVGRVQITEAQLLAAFELLDHEGRGYLTTDAFARVIGDHMSQEEIQEICKDVDQDGNGKIDYKEFVSHWRSITMKKKPLFRSKIEKVMMMQKVVRVLRSGRSQSSSSASAAEDTVEEIESSTSVLPAAVTPEPVESVPSENIRTKTKKSVSFREIAGMPMKYPDESSRPRIVCKRIFSAAFPTIKQESDDDDDFTAGFQGWIRQAPECFDTPFDAV